MLVSAVPSALAQGALTNGWQHTGTIAPVGDSDTWTFEANVGDAIVVRVGELAPLTFAPRIQLFSPTAVSLGSVATAFGAEIAVTATNSGTFTVVVSDNTGTQTNSYRLTLAKTGEAVVVSPGDEGGPMTNGVMHTGTIDVGDLDVWTVASTAGERIVVRIGETNSVGTFTPQVRIYNPTGALLDTSSTGFGAEVEVTATISGTFLVVVGDISGSWSGSGPYRLTLAKTGDPVVVSPGDEGGPMTNGVMHAGTIDLGDLDVWTVAATAGERIVARVGETNSVGTFTPQVRIYSPTGALLDTSSSSFGAEVEVTATDSGTFLVVVGDISGSWSGSGPYRLTLAKTGDPVVVSPGDEGGPMTNGVMHTGTIDLGDMDVWTVAATTGDAIVVRMGEVTGGSTLNPQVRIYGPNGVLRGNVDTAFGAEVAITATNSGTFLVVAGDFAGSYSGSGPYRLTLARTGDPVMVSGGDEGGPMTNGVMHTGTIDLGDLDVWTIEATLGEAIVVRMGEVTAGSTLNPQVRIYGPNGVLRGNVDTTVGAEVAITATNSGTFLVVAGDYAGSWSGSGPYRLTLAKTGDPVVVSAGDEGGPMTGAGVYSGTIEVGDLDVFSFTACAGDSIVLKLDEAVVASPLTPQLRLYGRDGVLLNTTAGAATAQISRSTPASGEYLLVAGDLSGSWSGSGDYVLTVNGLADGFKLCSPAISGPSLNVSAVGGVAGVDGVLYTHTNVAVPTSVWTPVSTNQFDAFGVWTYTNLFNPAEPQRYFILRMP